MEFTTKKSDVLKAIQSLQTQAAAYNQLADFSDVLLHTIGGDKIELSAPDVLVDARIRIDAEVKQSGAVFLQVKHFSAILYRANAETVHFTMLSDGQVRLDIGVKTSRLQGTSYASFAPPSFAEHQIFAKKRRKVGAATLLSFFAHLVLAVILTLVVKDQYLEEEEGITVEILDRLPPSARVLKKPLVKRVQPKVALPKSFKLTSAPTQVAETARPSIPAMRHDLELPKMPDAIAVPVTTTARVRAVPRSRVVSSTAAGTGDRQSGEGLLTGRFRAPSRGDVRSRGIASMIESTRAVDSADLSDARFTNLVMVPEDKLGAVLIGEGADIQGHIKFIRLKHSLSDWWQDPTALPSFMKWLSEHTRLRADMKFEGGALPMTDPRILDAPIIFMTGHDKDITVGRDLVKGGPLTDSFTSAERAALRKYILERGGMLFFDDCGFNGLFAAQVADELRQIFPEYPLENIPHDHEIYTIYYTLSVPPTGGDVFWGSENNPKASKFRYQKGISIGRRLAVVYNRKDYMCAMETAEIESRTMLRMRRSADVHRFMTNLLFYAMRYGGNTDRSGYKNY